MQNIRKRPLVPTLQGSLLLLLATLVTACVTMRSGAHQADNVSLTGYQSFAWIADDPWIVADTNSASISPLTRDKIAEALRSAFEARGYSYTQDKSAADFIVAYTVGTRDRINVSSYPVAYRYDWDWYPYSRRYRHADFDAHSYTEGTLGVDVFDAQTKKPVWHGWATKRVVGADIDDPSPAIKRAAAAIVDHFPTPDG